MNLDYKEKYLKYKGKYLLAKTQQGGISQQDKQIQYSNLYNFFTNESLPKNYSNSTFIELYNNELIVLNIFKNPLFENKLLTLWGILIGKITKPKLFQNNRKTFFYYALDLLINKDLTLEEFNSQVAKL